MAFIQYPISIIHYKSAFLALCSLLLASCTPGNLDMVGMFYTRSESANERFLLSEAYNASTSPDTVRVSDDTYHFYAYTDVHVDSTTQNLDTVVATYLADADAAPFILCLGDIINAVGHYPKYQASVAPIAEAGRTLYSTPGNHDIYYDQWSIYQSYYPTSHYFFIVLTPSGAHDLYICIDSSNGTLGTLQLQWLRTLLKEQATRGHRHTVVFTHTNLWKLDQSQGHTSNFPLEETYELADLFSRYGVEIVLQGHSHARYLQAFKGVQYIRLDALEDHYYNAFYTRFTLGQKASANTSASSTSSSANASATSISWEYIPVGPQLEHGNFVYRPDM